MHIDKLLWPDRRHRLWTLPRNGKVQHCHAERSEGEAKHLSAHRTRPFASLRVTIEEADKCSLSASHCPI